MLEALDQLLQQRSFAGAREVEAVVRLLRAHPQVAAASVAPHRTSPIQAPAFQVSLWHTVAMAGQCSAVQRSPVQDSRVRHCAVQYSVLQVPGACPGRARHRHSHRC